MTWIVLIAADLNAYLVGAQMDAIRTAALEAGQGDPFDEIMPTVAARIRAEVRGCDRNRVSQTPNAIPLDLKSTACALMIEAMQPRLLLELSEDQRRAADAARAYLKRIALCQVPIALPDDPEPVDDVQRSTAIEVVSHNFRQASRRQTRGLL